MWSRFAGRPQRRTAAGRCSIGFMRRTIVGFRPWVRTRGILQAITNGARAAGNPAAHCGQNHRTGGGASADATAEPDGGLPSLTAGTEEDRRALGRSKMLAWIPSLSAAWTTAGPRRSLSDGLAAHPEAAGPRTPGAGLGGHGNWGGAEGRREQDMDGSPSRPDRPITTQRPA